MNSLIVSLHDVSPQTFAVSRQILADLQDAGIQPLSLLVIPDHHHHGHFLQDAAFCRWLQEMEKSGHEIVTHGYFHQRDRSANESTRDKMITRIYTADEGEFYDVSEAAAAEKMARAQLEFAKIGLAPVGFVAPAWLLSAPAQNAATKIGFRYTTTLQEIRILSGRVGVPPAVFGVSPKNPHSEGDIPPTQSGDHRSQSLVYSVRSAWRRLISIGWNRFLLARLEKNPVARLGIHPPDWQYPAIRQEILRLAKYLAARREVLTYSQWTAR